MVTSADLAGSLGLDWSPFQQGLDDALSYATAWGAKVGSVLDLKLTLDTSAISGAASGLESVAGTAQQMALNLDAAATSQTGLNQSMGQVSGLAADIIAKLQGTIQATSQYTGAVQENAAAQAAAATGAQSSTAALAGLGAASATAGTGVQGLTGNVASFEAVVDGLVASAAAAIASTVTLAAAEASSAVSASASATAAEALLAAQVALADGETRVAQGAALAAAAARVHATTLTDENTQTLITTASLQQQAQANQQLIASLTPEAQARRTAAQAAQEQAQASRQLASESQALVSQFTAMGVPAAAMVGYLTQGTAALRQMGSDAGPTTNSLLGLSVAETGVANAALLVVQATLQMTSNYVAYADQIRNTAAMTGLTQQTVEELNAALSANGVNAGQATLALGMMQQKAENLRQEIEAGKAPTGTMAEGLKALGINAAQFTMATPDQQLRMFADAVAANKGNAGALGAEFDILGRYGRALIPVFQDGSVVFDHWGNIIQQSGADVSQQQTAVLAWHDALTKFHLEVQGTADVVGSDFLPVLSTSISIFRQGVVVAQDAADAWDKLPAPVRDAAIAFGLAATAVPLVGAGFNLLLATGGALGGIISTTGASFVALAGALGLTTVAETVEAAAATEAAVATGALEAVASAGLIPALALIAGGVAAVVVGLSGWTSGNDAAADSARRAKDALDAETKSLQDHINALRQQPGNSDQGVYDQLSQDAAGYTATLQSLGTQISALNQQFGQQAADEAQAGAGLSGYSKEWVQSNSLLSASYYDILHGLQAQSPEYQKLEQSYTGVSTQLQALDPQLAGMSQKLAENAKDADETATQQAKLAAQYGLGTDSALAHAEAEEKVATAAKQAAQSTAQGIAFRDAAAEASKLAALSDADWAKAQTDLGNLAKSNNQELAASAKLVLTLAEAFRVLTPAEIAAAEAGKNTAQAAIATAQQYGVTADAGYALAGAKTALVNVLKEEQAGTASVSAVNTAYANSVAAAADPTTNWAQRTKDLTTAQKDAAPELAQSIALQLELDKVVRGLPAAYAAAATGTQSLSAAAGIQSTALAEGAGRVADLTAAVDKEKQGAIEAAVVQQQLAQARQFGAQSADQQQATLTALQLEIDTTSGSTKSYAEEQQKLDLAYQVLGPDVADLVIKHQDLADAFGFAKTNVVDLQSKFPDLIQSLKDGTTNANDFRDALMGMASKPTQDELNLQAQLAGVKTQLAAVNAELNNSSPMERRIAQLQQMVLQDEESGASATKLAQDQAELQHQIDAATASGNADAAARGVAIGQTIDAFTRQQTQISSNLDSDRAQRESIGATTAAYQAQATGSSLSLAQLVHAAQQSFNGQVTAAQGVAEKVGPAGKAAGDANTQELSKSMAAGIEQLNQTLATLPAKLAEALTNPAAFTKAGADNADAHRTSLLNGLDVTKIDAAKAVTGIASAMTQQAGFQAAGQTNGDAFSAGLIAAIDAAMRTAAQHVKAGGATLAGLASAAGTSGSRSTAGAGFSLGFDANGFFYPTEGPVTQGYGENGEKGVDLGVATGTPLASGIAGKIVDVQAPSPEQAAAGLGYWVTIDAGNGLQEVIGHIDTMLVNVGDLVKQGQVVGVSGGEFQPGHEDSSISSGPHTEVRVLINGGLVNPETVLGKVLQAAPGATTDGGTVAVNVAPSVGGHLLTPEQYAAIQAHESTLPLPSPGNPEPMFGLTNGAAGSFAVGQQVFTSGGTAAASASMGLAAGQTRADLLPSVDAGESAFDALIQQNDPGAVAVLQQQGFAAFMNRIAPWYAGPGEAPGFAADVIANAQAGVGTPGLAGPLPAPALETAAQQTSHEVAVTRDAGAAAADVTGAQNQLDQLQSRLDDLTSSQIPAAYQQQAQAAVSSAQTAISAQQSVLTAAQKVQSDIANNVDDNTLRVDAAALASAKTQAGALDSAANSANTSYNKLFTEIGNDQKAIASGTDTMNTDLLKLAGQDALVSQGQQDHATKVGATYQQASGVALQAWMQYGIAQDALQTALANGADAKTLAGLRTTLEADKTKAESAEKTADTAFAAWDKEYKAEAQARKDLATAIRTDVTDEVNLTAGLASAWTKVRTSIQEVAQRMGPDFAVGSGRVVDLAHNSATAAALAYHTAQATVIQDEQALTGELSAQDRLRLTDKTTTDKDIAASALQSAQDQEKAFGLVTDAFNAMNANLAAAAKNRLGMDAQGYDDWTNKQLTGVGLVVDATTSGEEKKLTAARTTYDAVVADSATASQKLIKDQNDYNNAVARGDAVVAAQAQTAVSADQIRISSDQAAAQAIVQQYGTIQDAVHTAATAEIDAAKESAQGQITSLSAVRDADLQAIADRKTALDALVQKEQQGLSDTATKQKDAIDASTAVKVGAIQKQLDDAQHALDLQKLMEDEEALRNATTSQQRITAEKALADFKVQLEDKQRQAAIKDLQEQAAAAKKHIDEQTTLQKQALTDQTTAQKTALDKQATQLKNLYDDPKTGLVSIQKAAIAELDRANAAHYTKQEGDAVADAQRMLAIAQQSGQDQATAIATAASAVLPTVGGLATSPITVQPSSAALTATTTNTTATGANTTALQQLTQALGPNGGAGSATTATGALVRPEGQDQTAVHLTQDLSDQGRQFTQALLAGTGAFNMLASGDQATEARLAAQADAMGAAFGLPAGWWQHGIPGQYGQGFGGRTQQQALASIQDVGGSTDWHGELAAIEHLLAHPELWLVNQTEFKVGGDAIATALHDFENFQAQMLIKLGQYVPMPAALMQGNLKEMQAQFGQNITNPFWFFGEPNSSGGQTGQAGQAAGAYLSATGDNTSATTANTGAITMLTGALGASTTAQNSATAAQTAALVRPAGQDQTPVKLTQDLSDQGRQFTQALLAGAGAFTMLASGDQTTEARLAAQADAAGAAFGLPGGWWSHGIPGQYGQGFGGRTQQQALASVQDVGGSTDWHGQLAAIQYLLAHPDLWLTNTKEFKVGGPDGDAIATALHDFENFQAQMMIKLGQYVPMPDSLMQGNVKEMQAQFGKNVTNPFWFFGQPGAPGQAGGAASVASDTANTAATTANTTAVTANTTVLTTARSGWGDTVKGTPIAGGTPPTATAAALATNTTALQANTAAVVQTGHWVGNTWTPDAIATALKSTTLPVTMSGPSAAALTTMAAQAPLQTAQLTTVGQAQGPQGTHLDAIAQSTGSTAASAQRWLEGIWGNGTQAFMVQSQMLHAFTNSPGIFVQVAQPAQGGGGSGITVNVPITLNATQGGTPDQLANEVAKQVHDQVLAEFNDLFGRGAKLAGA